MYHGEPSLLSSMFFESAYPKGVSLMRIVPLSATVALSLLAASTTAVAAPSGQVASKPPCTPRLTKIDGKTAAENCGPATLTLKVGGKSYSFKNGLCETSGPKVFTLDLGTLIVGDHAHNGGQPNFSMTVSGSTADVTAIYGGKDLVGAMTLATVKGAGNNTGTFVNRLLTPKLTGSWNCHGVIYKGPS